MKTKIFICHMLWKHQLPIMDRYCTYSIFDQCSFPLIWISSVKIRYPLVIIDLLLAKFQYFSRWNGITDRNYHYRSMIYYFTNQIICQISLHRWSKSVAYIKDDFKISYSLSFIYFLSKGFTCAITWTVFGDNFSEI